MPFPTPLKNLDTGVASTPTARLNVFAGGQPAMSAPADYGVVTATVARPDEFGAAAQGLANPPVAPSTASGPSVS